MSIQKLIDQTYSYMQTASKDLRGLYEDDMSDFESVQRLINSNDIDGAVAKIDDMDTTPREQIVLAIADEYGNGYVETVIGYEVNV